MGQSPGRAYGQRPLAVHTPPGGDTQASLHTLDTGFLGVGRGGPMDEDDYLAKVSAELITSTAGRAQARNPFKRHLLDLVFRGPVEPYLMTGHMWVAGTTVPVDGR